MVLQPVALVNRASHDDAGRPQSTAWMPFNAVAGDLAVDVVGLPECALDCQAVFEFVLRFEPAG